MVTLGPSGGATASVTNEPDKGWIYHTDPNPSQSKLRAGNGRLALPRSSTTVTSPRVGRHGSRGRLETRKQASLSLSIAELETGRVLCFDTQTTSLVLVVTVTGRPRLRRQVTVTVYQVLA